MTARPFIIGLCALALLAGCTSPATPDAVAASASSQIVETTTTTAAPIVLATAANLGLPIGQCWNELAVATSTSTTSAVHTTADPTATTEAPTTTETTIPSPQIVAIVDCNGTNKGEIYSSFCIGLSPDAGEKVASGSGAQTSDLLDLVPCPGEPDLVWPGDRELVRAAARVCLNVFAQVFAESYSTSARVAKELIPNEGLWERGERRVVCSATQPPPTTTTTTTTSEP